MLLGASPGKAQGCQGSEGLSSASVPHCVVLVIAGSVICSQGLAYLWVKPALPVGLEGRLGPALALRLGDFLSSQRSGRPRPRLSKELAQFFQRPEGLCFLALLVPAPQIYPESPSQAQLTGVQSQMQFPRREELGGVTWSVWGAELDVGQAEAFPKSSSSSSLLGEHPTVPPFFCSFSLSPLMLCLSQSCLNRVPRDACPMGVRARVTVQSQWDRMGLS